MQKIFLSLFLGLFMLILQAQNESQNQKIKITGGLKMEGNFSGFNVNGQPDMKSQMGVGGTFGGFVNFGCTKHFSLQPEWLFHYKTTKIEYNNAPTSPYQYWGTEIAIYAIGQWQLGKGQIYIGGCPYTEFGFSATIKVNDEKIDLYKINDATKVSAMQTSSIGFGILFGYEFACRVQVNFSYKASFTNILDKNRSQFSLYPNAINIGIGYRFSK